MIYKAYKISELLNDTLYENAFLYIRNNNAQHILVSSCADKQTIYSSEYILNLLLEKFPSLVDIINTKAIISNRSTKTPRNKKIFFIIFIIVRFLIEVKIKKKTVLKFFKTVLSNWILTY